MQRRFNRLVPQRVGALEDSYLRRRRPLGEVRLIFGTSGEGADLRALREAQGLVTVESESADRRRRRVRLTSKSRAELAAYDRLSDELAASMLAAGHGRARASVGCDGGNRVPTEGVLGSTTRERARSGRSAIGHNQIRS